MDAVNDKRTYLGGVSAALAKVHKLLLENEIEFIEMKNGIRLNANDRLNVLLNSAEVAWLRDMSQLMAFVDEVYFQKEPIEDDQVRTIKKRVEDLILNQSDTEFSRKYRQLLAQVPDLMFEHGSLKVAVKNSPLSE